MEIRNGAQLTVRESQLAAFVNEGKIADVFGPGLYTLNTRNLPLLTNLNNWDKDFESFQVGRLFLLHANPDRSALGDRHAHHHPEEEFGAVRLRAYGIYSYRIADPRAFFTNVSAPANSTASRTSKASFATAIVARLTEVVAPSEVAFLDMAAHQAELAQKWRPSSSPR